MTWTIHPLDLGTAQLAETVLLDSPESSSERRVPSPSIAWLLADASHQEYILVDAGPCDDYEWGVRYHNGYLRSGKQNITAQLAQYGLIPEQISSVILTHLHWDHAYGVLDVPKAQVVLQRRELHYAIDPRPKDAIVYETSIRSQLPFYFYFFHRLQLVDGDVDFRPGLRLLTLPGHTPGSQGVLVDTEQGQTLLAGDLINIPENWEQRRTGGIVYDRQEYQDSFRKVEALQARILPSHDYRAWDMLGLPAPR